MALPKRLRIGYVTYKVTEMPPDKSIEGDFNVHECGIRVRTKDRSSDYAANTTIHEIFHGIFYHAGLQALPRMSDGLEEQIVNGMANGLSQVIRDNPEAMRNILKMAAKK